MDLCPWFPQLAHDFFQTHDQVAKGTEQKKVVSIDKSADGCIQGHALHAAGTTGDLLNSKLIGSKVRYQSQTELPS